MYGELEVAIIYFNSIIPAFIWKGRKPNACHDKCYRRQNSNQLPLECRSQTRYQCLRVRSSMSGKDAGKAVPVSWPVMGSILWRAIPRRT